MLITYFILRRPQVPNRSKKPDPVESNVHLRCWQPVTWVKPRMSLSHLGPGTQLGTLLARRADS